VPIIKFADRKKQGEEEVADSREEESRDMRVKNLLKRIQKGILEDRPRAIIEGRRARNKCDA